MYDLAIVGGGPGGLSAAVYATRANLKTILFENAIEGGQLNVTDEIENYLGFSKISGVELALKFANHAKAYNLEIIQKKVIHLKKNKNFFELTLENNKKIQAYTIILATGGRPKKLKIPGEKELLGNGVSYCATCDGFFFKNKPVLVVGGGDSAAEEALFLAKLCNKVYLSHRRSNLRASKILQKRIFANDKIIVLWNTVATKILAKNNNVSSIELTNTKTNKKEKLEVEGIFIFIGYEPNNQLVFDKSLLDSNGTVITNSSCETSILGLYAIGDLRSKAARQIVLSVADGCNAAIASAKYIENIKP